MKWILYGVLGVANILIVLVIYLLYRKLFGGKSVLNEDDADDTENEESMGAMSMDEPEMDEMSLDDMSDDIDLSDDSSDQADITLDGIDSDSGDPLDGLSQDEEPEFSLDDFAPDELDDDEDKK